jgi:nicotinate-nucleotide pyrophosphorylase (carboxylating)
MTLSDQLIEDLLTRSFEEDLGARGDITSLATIPADRTAGLVIRARSEGCLAGIGIAARAFGRLDPKAKITLHKTDGDLLAPGDDILSVSGNARALLAAERTALNIAGRLSGIASATHRFASLITHTKAKICDTRKTTPGLRAFEKYAVKAGGGVNHRFGLYDAVLIKDNHIAVAGGVRAAAVAALDHAPKGVRIEVEVDTVYQLRELLDLKIDAVLLDNMNPAQLRECVALIGGRFIAEASGGITLETVAAIAESGVDIISSGWLTHSAPCLDLGLDIDL